MTINLEKALIKANKKILDPLELLLIKEYETNGAMINDDSLKRVGLIKQIKLGKDTIDWHQNHENETKRFKQERVFHISQIEETCNKYRLRFLPSVMYEGTIDKELPYKITNFEAAYGVKCECVEPKNHRFLTDEETQNTFIMAPASSFKLQEKPKDPLFFYKINEEYYYLIHKWGNDLNVFRRIFPILSSPWFYYLSMFLLGFINFAMVKPDGHYTISEKLNLTAGILVVAWIFIYTLYCLIEKNEWPSWIKREQFNSQYI